MLSPKRLFLWSIFAALLLTGRSEVFAYDEEMVDEDELVPQQRRELWDFFSFLSLLNLLGPHHCFHPDGTADWGPQNGPKWHDCQREAMATSMPSSSSSSSRAAYDAAESSEVITSGNGNDGTGWSNAAVGFQLWMLFVAGSILSAMIAVGMGQRKDPAGFGKHDMSGAVMRRVGAVSAFASGAFPSKGKAVEMSASRPEYRLDMSPQGDHMSPQGDDLSTTSASV